jgi:hypothetical protein
MELFNRLKVRELGETEKDFWRSGKKGFSATFCGKMQEKSGFECSFTLTSKP